MTLSEFQQWLNMRGPAIKVDGQGGPATRAAIMHVFADKNAKAITEQDIVHVALGLGVSVKQLKAVAKVESGGGGWNDQGQPKALYEKHYAWRRLKIRIPLLSDPTPGGYTIDADRDGLNDSWEKIADMAMKNPIVAFESASFGKFQVMGAWATKLGYANAIEMAYSLVSSELAHYELLSRYIRHFNLVPALRALSTNAKDCRAFAKGYNGPTYWKAKPPYDERLARAML